MLLAVARHWLRCTADEAEARIGDVETLREMVAYMTYEQDEHEEHRKQQLKQQQEQ